MNIHITGSLRPFSHLPGSSCIIPMSGWILTAFPCLLLFKHIVSKESIEVKLSLKGPVESFTLQQDLEKGSVAIFGCAVQGYYRLKASQQGNGLVLNVERTPKEGVVLIHGEKTYQLHAPLEIILSANQEAHWHKKEEKLSLGVHKSQDWMMMRKRASLAEILPHWMRLGQMIPYQEGSKPKSAVVELLDQCLQMRIDKRTSALQSSLKSLFSVGFSSMLVPRLQDDEYQGIVPDCDESTDEGRLNLLLVGSRLIRSMFFFESHGIYQLLPCLLPDFHSGRVNNITTSSGDKISFAWSKHKLREVMVTAASEAILFHFPNDIKRFRLKFHPSDKGAVLDAGAKLLTQRGSCIFLDRFEK
ncbi:MAG: hypothetical protein EBZ47_04550 [Chlamydiae bacterium]|nr:hypothetical protein [Chlamydiota bacterium]